MLEHVVAEDVKKAQEFVAGGDLRARGNAWLRTAWAKGGAGRFFELVPHQDSVKCLENRNFD